MHGVCTRWNGDERVARSWGRRPCRGIVKEKRRAAVTNEREVAGNRTQGHRVPSSGTDHNAT
jgi:hypothetical protein